MQKMIRLAALALACFTLILLAFAYTTGDARDPAATPLAAGPSDSQADVHLRLSRGLSAPDAAGSTPALVGLEDRDGKGALVLAGCVVAAFAIAFSLGTFLRAQRSRWRRRAELATALRIEPALEKPNHDTYAGAALIRSPEEEALERMAQAVEERELEIQSLHREISDWQGNWHDAKGRLAEQQETIDALEEELAAARSTVSGLRRYLSELQRQRSAPDDSQFVEEVDAWIARFMSPVPRA